MIKYIFLFNIASELACLITWRNFLLPAIIGDMTETLMVVTGTHFHDD